MNYVQLPRPVMRYAMHECACHSLRGMSRCGASSAMGPWSSGESDLPSSSTRDHLFIFHAGPPLRSIDNGEIVNRINTPSLVWCLCVVILSVCSRLFARLAIFVHRSNRSRPVGCPRWTTPCGAGPNKGPSSFTTVCSILHPTCPFIIQ